MTVPDAPVRKTSSLSIAGFVVAVLAVLLSLSGGGAIPAIVATLLVAFGERGHARSGIGRAARVLAMVAIVVSVVVFIARVSA